MSKNRKGRADVAGQHPADAAVHQGAPEGAQPPVAGVAGVEPAPQAADGVADPVVGNGDGGNEDQVAAAEAAGEGVAEGDGDGVEGQGTGTDADVAAQGAGDPGLEDAARLETEAEAADQDEARDLARLADDGGPEWPLDAAQGDDAAEAALAGAYPQENRTMPPDLVELVGAARVFAYDENGYPGDAAQRRLDRALEAFADRVPWDDEPLDQVEADNEASRPKWDDNVLAATLAGARVTGDNPDRYGDDLNLAGDAMSHARAHLAASFLRANRDAKPETIVIHLRMNGHRQTREAAGRVAVAWSVFAFTLNALDALDAEQRAKDEAKHREADAADRRRAGARRDQLAMLPYDNDPRTDIARRL